MNGYKYYDGVVRRLSIFNRIDRQLECSILHKLMELMVYQYSKTVDVCVLTKHTLISYWLWYLLRHSRTHHAGYRMFAETDFVQSAFKRIRGGNGSDKEYAPFFFLVDQYWPDRLCLDLPACRFGCMDGQLHFCRYRSMFIEDGPITCLHHWNCSFFKIAPRITYFFKIIHQYCCKF